MSSGDFDGDGDVDFEDFNDLANNYTGPRTSEPSVSPVEMPSV